MSDGTQTANVLSGQHIASRVPRLISRLYRAADLPARAGILSALIRPLGPLGLAAVASGAFASLLQRQRGAGIEVGLDEAMRFDSSQVFELARFVEQVDTDVFQQVVRMVLDSPAGFTAFGVAVAMVVVRQYRRRDRSDRRV
jgi:hypothetical protein